MNASRRWVIVLFTIAFLVARVTGAHLHLCLDGSEPLAQLHVSDAAEVDHHHDSGVNQAHEDVDVDALGNVVAKAAKVDLPLAALFAWAFVLYFVVALLQPVWAAIKVPPRPPPRFLRPLLRAPPV